MKTSLLAFSIFCFAFTIELFIGITAAAPEPVLDISGHKLRTGVKYYILPVTRGKGGGLTVASRGNNTCPLFVVQEKLDVFNGQPVTFTPYNAKDGVILTSTDMNIKSVTTTTTCVKSSVWRLLKVFSGVWFLSTDGVGGNPGVDTIVNWFKIEKAMKDYELSFCPSVCKCQTLCRALGIYIDDDGSGHLALSDKVPSFRVVFKRA
ncbi:kunitz trypsin inhibitor 5-like [Gastrolobium bilobum]|uniref:kunitz trypsin inhibitor 5-like n=1 Tax=Gastrolobium bilobum TaxID=150636 RepID=UPI002AB1EAB3|nr:kunitz trypsin inhibitor 5-like [Gastrolobium bilobum]